MCTRLIEVAGIEAFGRRMANALNESALVLMTSLGHRTGLFDAMAELPPSTSHAIATAAGLNERYVREWLGALVAAGVVRYDDAEQTYRLPAEHAACLTRAARPANFAVTAQWLALMGGVEDDVVAAFRHGRGVPYSAYRSFHRVMAEESDQSVVAGLFANILPLVPGLVDRLTAGVDALDVGCGSGLALIEMAAAYPASRFTGYDASEEAVASATAGARRRGVTTVRFEVVDAATIAGTAAFDVIFAFDAIHDQADPAAVLKNIARLLRPDGVFLMQDIAASSRVHENAENPIGTFIYAISVMHCMSVSLANNGVGLGAAWGWQLAERMLREAGFTDVTRSSLPHDQLNFYYVARR